MFFINLLQSFFCRTIQFKFHDIYEFVRLQNKVDAPFACMIFHFGIKAYEFENDKKHIFVMLLLLANHIIACICKETLQTSEERVIVTGTYFTDKLLNFKRRLHLIYVRIIRK